MVHPSPLDLIQHHILQPILVGLHDQQSPSLDPADLLVPGHMVARGELEEVADQISEQVKLPDGLMRPRIRREPALKEAWERISTLEGPARASRTPVVGAIGPAPGNEMVIPASASQGGTGLEELPAEPSAGQGLLNPGSQDDGEADTPAGEGDRNVG